MELTKVRLRKQYKIPSKLSNSSAMDYRMAHQWISERTRMASSTLLQKRWIR